MPDWNYGYAGHVPKPVTADMLYPSPGTVLAMMYVQENVTYNEGPIVMADTSLDKTKKTQLGMIIRVGWEPEDLEKEELRPLKHIKPGLVFLIGRTSGAELSFEYDSNLKYSRLVPSDILCGIAFPVGVANPFEGVEYDRSFETPQELRDPAQLTFGEELED